MVALSDSNSQTIGGPFYSAHDDGGFVLHWRGARNFACAGPVVFNTPVAVYRNKRSNSGRSESAAD
jgi:hypothetical protein